jgi:hypothetical protein
LAGNVGGGNYSDLVAQIPLRWLTSKAALHGLTFRADITIDDSTAKAELYDSFVADDIPDCCRRCSFSTALDTGGRSTARRTRRFQP